ncbi:MAG: alpha-ketoacid dehydrogenase subunit beta [Legionellales bacterium]|nr:alpha-ketoacid dehydrogenase subunit beta [Legionellales bacterium]
MPKVTLIDAVNLALTYEMTNDPNTILIGEDIGINGGVFRATQGLQEKFGENRVIDSPLAESMIAGLSIGMSTHGLKPIAEFQFMGFIYPAMNQIINHACRMRNRTRGRLTCPIVFRAPFGGFIHAPEHHSESTESMFAHIPGLRVVIPTSPERAYGLLLAAIRDPDPVLFLEPKRIYRIHKQEIENNGVALPLDTAFTLREGSDITLISFGASIIETTQAAEELEKCNISAEVIDLATIKPIDYETILSSVEKTGRCIIVHEAAKSFGVGAEIAATIAEKALTSLLAPIRRITGYDIVMPYYKMEKLNMVKPKKIVQAAIETMEYT